MNQRAFRTLFLWMIWAATAIIVYATLYRDTAVWEFVGQDSSRVTWLIIGTFLFGVVGSFALTMLVTFEWIRALAVQTEAETGGLDGIATKGRRRAVDRFFSALKTTLEVDGQPDVEALLHVELAVFKRIGQFVEVIGNLLITLGLIGTVMGLTLVLTGLTSSLEALGHDQELLLAGLRKAMSGMGTAFYTTLLGAVLGGILLRVFAQITDHGVEGLYDMIMRVCLVYCSADYKPSLQRDMRFINQELQILRDHTKSLETAFDSSKKAIAVFHEEVTRINREQTMTGDESLDAQIARHRRYCETLREEALLLHSLRASWWARFVSLFRFR